MKKKSLILVAAVAGIIALFMLPWYGLDKVGSFIGQFLYMVFLITVGAIIIDSVINFSNRLIDALGKRQSAGNEEINAKMELIMQRMQVIENKLDKTNAILEKVSD